MLTKDILCAYLPYDLSLWHEGHEPKHILDVRIPKGIYESSMNAVTMTSMFGGNSKFKPILRPLSSLTKPINHNGETFVPIDVLGWNSYEHIIKSGDCTGVAYFYVQKLLSWHFDIFGLLKSGHAIELNEATEDTSTYTEREEK